MQSEARSRRRCRSRLRRPVGWITSWKPWPQLARSFRAILLPQMFPPWYLLLLLWGPLCFPLTRAEKVLFCWGPSSSQVFWVNYNDLTRLNSPQMAVYVGNVPPTTVFQLVKYYNSPRFLEGSRLPKVEELEGNRGLVN